MANPILKSDLISDDALRALEEMSRLLREDKENMDALMASFKQYAGQIHSVTSANGSNNDALAEALQKISELEKAYTDLQKAMKENADTQKAINAEKRKYAKLTEEEANNVRSLAQGMNAYVDLIKKGNKVTLQNKELVDVQNKSYNELYQTYNALKDALNRMTTEERLNTEVGKTMTAQALKLRDTMNELQKSTGNYTLQVGKYRAAFDGLGYSFQQILREAPSALNFQQFFLAISNNIPLFMDQLEGYRKKQGEIIESLRIMEAEGKKGTAEYVKLASNVESWGKHLLKSLVSWQTAIIGITMVVRLYGSEIIDWVKKLFNGVKEVKNELSATAAMGQLMADVTKKTADEITELGLVVARLKEVKRGTDEWKAGIATVNKITKKNLDSTTATIGEVEKVTEAYRVQAEQLAKNAVLTDMIGKSNANQVLRDIAYSAADYDTARATLGLKIDSKEEKQFKDLYEAMKKRQISATGVDYEPTKAYFMQGEMHTLPNTESLAGYKKRMQKAYDDSVQEYKNFINKRLAVLSPDAVKKLEDEYKLVNPLAKDPKVRTYSLRDVDFLESELLDKDAVIELESSYKRRLAMLEEQEEKERLVLKEKYEHELKDLEFNREKKLITEKQYEEQRARLDANYNDLIKTNYEGNFEEMGVIQRKYWNKRNEVSAKEAEREEKEALAREKKAIKDLENEYASQYRVVQRRVKTMQQEIQRNEDLAFNIAKAREELAKLNEQTITAGEDATGYTERVRKLTEQIEKWRKQMQFDKQLSNYGSMWDIFKRNGAFEAGNGTMRGIAKNLLGDMADNLDDSQIEQVYDTWLQNTEKAATEWYNTTMGYINDLISAYVELANAKAEAAKEATDAAQEEYEKEKALLEAGYASRVEATWAEYQEKKAAQEKAEADAKAAAKAQQEINNLSTMGSLITAAANIWKTFTEIPVVGIPLAIAATGTMFGAFLAAKIKANEVSKYGEGGFEVLEGGSHASGNDIDLGVRNRRGRRMRAEGKEGLGIFSRRAMSHYGARNIEAMVDSVNRLEFEGSAAKRMNIERSVGMQVLSMPRTDLHRLESGMDKLVSYGSLSRTVNADGSVTEYRKNGKVTIKKG